MSQQPKRQIKRNRFMINRSIFLEMDPGRVSTSIYGNEGVELIDLAEAEAQEALRNRRPFYYTAGVLALISALVRQPLLFVAALLIVALTAIPEIWYRYGLRQLVVARRPATTRAVFGDSTEVTLRIENRKLLPLPFLEVVDDFPDALPVEGMRLGPSAKPERATLTNTVSLWAYERVRRRYRVRAIARGAYSFGPMTVRVGDPFGILTRETTANVTATLLVHPLVAPIERFGLASKAPFGDRKSPRRLLEDPLRVSGIRDYEPGDEPRRIHWKATARTGSLQSKVYEPSTRHTLAVFVEVRTYNRSLMGYDPQLVELAITAAASVATWAFEQKYAVGVYSNGTVSTADLDGAPLVYRGAESQAERSGGEGNVPVNGASGTRGAEGSTYWRGEIDTPAIGDMAMRVGSSLRLRVPPSARPEQEVKILDGLARLLPYYGLPMDELVVMEQHRLPLGATVVYIGAEAAVDVPLILALRRLREKGHAVSLLLTRADDASASGEPQAAPGEGLLHVADLPVHYLGGRQLWRELESDVLGHGVERKASSYTQQSSMRRDGDDHGDERGNGDGGGLQGTDGTNTLGTASATVWSAEAARMKGLAALSKPAPAPVHGDVNGGTAGQTNRGTDNRATGGTGEPSGSSGTATSPGRTGWRKARSLVVE